MGLAEGTLMAARSHCGHNCPQTLGLRCCRSVTETKSDPPHYLRMAWQLIFKAPDDDSDEAALSHVEPPNPAARKPVSMTVQLDPGSIVVASGDDEDDD